MTFVPKGCRRLSLPLPPKYKKPCKKHWCWKMRFIRLRKINDCKRKPYKINRRKALRNAYWRWLVAKNCLDKLNGTKLFVTCGKAGNYGKAPPKNKPKCNRCMRIARENFRRNCIRTNKTYAGRLKCVNLYNTSKNGQWKLCGKITNVPKPKKPSKICTKAMANALKAGFRKCQKHISSCRRRSCFRHYRRKYHPCKISTPSRCSKTEWKQWYAAKKNCWNKGGKIVAWRKRQLQRQCFLKLNRSSPLRKCKKFPVPKVIPRPVTKPQKCKKGYVTNFYTRVAKCNLLWKKSWGPTRAKYIRCSTILKRRYRFLKRKQCTIKNPRFRRPKGRKCVKPRCTRTMRKNWYKLVKECRNRPKYLSKRIRGPIDWPYWSWGVIKRCYDGINTKKIARICHVRAKMTKPRPAPKKRPTCDVKAWNRKVQRCLNLWKSRVIGKNVDWKMFKARVTNACLGNLRRLKKRNLKYRLCKTVKNLPIP